MPAFARAAGERQMREMLTCEAPFNRCWSIRGSAASGYTYRHSNFRLWDATIRVRDDGFHWTIRNHYDGAPIASGISTRIAEAYATATRPADHGIGV